MLSPSSQIQSFLDTQYRDLNFEKFCSNLKGVGVSYFVFNAMTNDLSFFSKNQYICSCFRYDIAKEMKHDWPSLAEELHAIELEKAITQVDSQQIDSVTFHRLAQAAGVISCTIFLEARKIYYFGLNGDFYLETF